MPAPPPLHIPGRAGPAKLRHLARQLSAPGTKPPYRIAAEVLALRAGGQRWFYRNRLLYHGDAGRPADYLSKAEDAALVAANERRGGWLRLLRDKTLLDDALRRAGLPLPAYLGQTQAGFLVRHGQEDAPIRSPDELARALAEMAGRSPSGAVFAKPVQANKGAGAVRVGPGDPNGDAGGKLPMLFREVHRTDYLFQEAMRQHPELEALHPASLNTMRVVTGRPPSGSRPVLAVVLRMGRGGRSVDNASAGGVFVGVDRDSGRLRPRAKSYHRHGGGSFASHPDTGVPFGGFTVPLFGDVLDLAQRAHDRVPVLYAGWDVALSPDGPFLVEGNAFPEWLLPDVAHGGLGADPLVRAFVDEALGRG